ncbi:chitosanase [Deinococcus cellulosilyticus]|uniref:Chitosanase n=1 Tax=Deinococcus cellulosilyticus (strain DSM 18568 / NBRC 106333 / KACC 11606 / 5516J-15) TaxID=1223518 RepID=A0A511MV69_DEIC1|nr:chitosanase [Deinococcus cellulosilyticus]GEM44479.1 hypothetical protein DC3_01140 [Deinococcus cellulosilyticus NBRC 106333 = KACC 11606]
MFRFSRGFSLMALAITLAACGGNSNKEFTPQATFDAFSQIEAEQYDAQTGTQRETTRDTGLGENVGYIDPGDTLTYNSVSFSSTATRMQFRVASASSGGTIEVREGSATGTLLGKVTVPSTGDWQNWTTVSSTVNISPATRKLVLVFRGTELYGLMNINWFRFLKADTTAPTRPASLAGSNVTSSSVKLSWSASTDNVGVTGYNILKNGSHAGSASGTSFTVTGLAANTSYTFSVKARDAAGNLSVSSDAVTVKTLPSSSGADLTDPGKKDIAMQLVSSAENSSLDWRAQYKYIEDIQDGRGYTAGIIGFCSGTGDMLELVEAYTRMKPSNVLAKYLPALRQVNGTDSHAGLDPNFPADWRTAAQDTTFQQAQDSERDRGYFNPAVGQAKTDGLRALGQFIYYDAMVMHGPGTDPVSFGGIRATAMRNAKTPAQGGSEVTYLHAFLNARVAAMKTEEAHSDTSRVDTAQRVFLNNGNLDLNTPLTWQVYGDTYNIP